MSQDNHRTEPEKEVGGHATPRNADVPSAEAGINESNADKPDSESFSSESGQDAAGLPDGSGNDLPQETSPNDDEESFDAG